MRISKKVIQAIREVVGDKIEVGYLGNIVEIDFGSVVLKFEHVLHDAIRARIERTKYVETDYPVDTRWDKVTEASVCKVMQLVVGTNSEYALYRCSGKYLVVSKKAKTLRSYAIMTLTTNPDTGDYKFGHDIEITCTSLPGIIEDEQFQPTTDNRKFECINTTADCAVVLDNEDSPYCPFIFSTPGVIAALDTDYLMSSVKALLDSPFCSSMLERTMNCLDLDIKVPYTVIPDVIVNASVEVVIVLLTEYETQLTLLRHGLKSPLSLSRMYHIQATVK